MNALVRGGVDRFLSLPAFFREARGGLVDFLAECWRAVEDSDLVVFIPTTFFVAEFRAHARHTFGSRRIAADVSDGEACDGICSAAAIAAR